MRKASRPSRRIELGEAADPQSDEKRRAEQMLAYDTGRQSRALCEPIVLCGVNQVTEHSGKNGADDKNRNQDPNRFAAPVPNLQQQAQGRGFHDGDTPA
jgi:hypothetical protein